MMKRIRQIFLAVLSLAGIALLILSLTPLGFPMILNLINANIDGTVTVEGISGSILQEIRADKIVYEDASLRVELNKASLDWKPGRLLNKTIFIQDFKSESVDITRFDTPETAADALQVELADFESKDVVFILNNAALNNIQIHNPDIFIETFTTTIAISDNGVRFRDTQIVHENIAAVINGNIGAEFNPPINIQSQQTITFDTVNTINGQSKITGDFELVEANQTFMHGIDGELNILVKNIGQGFHMDATGRAAIKDLAQVNELLSGNVQVDLNFQYNHANGSGAFNFDAQNSTVNDAPFQMHFAGILKDHTVSWNNNLFDLGKNHLETSGYYGHGVGRISWDITGENLARISRHLGGRLITSGQVDFSENTWKSQLNLTADTFRAGPVFAKSLNIKDATLGNAPNQVFAMQAHGHLLQYDEFAVDALDLIIQGPASNLSTDLSLTSFDTILKTQFRANIVDADNLQAAVNQLSLSFPNKLTYQLRRPFNIAWEQQQLSLSPEACLAQQNSAFCVKLLDNPAEQQVAFTLEQFPNSIFTSYLHRYLSLTGTTSANAVLGFDKLGIKSLLLDANMTPGTVTLGRNETRQREWFGIGGATLHWDMNPSTINADGKLSLIDADHLAFTLDVQNWQDLPNAMLKSDFQGNIQNWEPLKLVITETDDFSGEVVLNLQASGKVLSPTFDGGLRLQNGRIAMPAYGITLTDAFLNLEPTLQQHQLRLTGGVTSGEGNIELDGQLSLAQTWPKLDLAVRGNAFEISNRASAKVLTSPDLRIQIQEQIIDVSGRVTIPDAALNIKSHQSYIAPSPDIILIHEQTEQKGFLYTINTNVTLALGDKISLKAGNLNTGLAGELNIKKEGDATPRGTGEIRAVNGVYSAYGQTIDLSQAVLTFSQSPIDNPKLFIEATRKIQIVSGSDASYLFTDAPASPRTLQEGTVGIRITGTVQNPKYTFFSNPPMSEEDQLSYLLTGAPSSQVGAAQAAFMFAALTEASSMLGFSDTDSSRLQNITQTIGLDFNVQTGSHIDKDTGETVTDTNLVVGKAVVPKLYISYSIGLLDPMNLFRARYQLSDRWAVQSQTNSQGDAGGDFLYGIETDKFLGMD